MKRPQFNRVTCGVTSLLVGYVAMLITPHVWGVFASSEPPRHLDLSLFWGVAMGLFWAVDQLGWVRAPYTRSPLALTDDDAIDKTPSSGTPRRPPKPPDPRPPRANGY